MADLGGVWGLTRRGLSLWLQDALARRRADGWHWTQTALSRASGISRQTISEILNEKTDPRPETIQALAAALGVKLPAFEKLEESATLQVRERPAVPYGIEEAEGDPEEAPGWMWGQQDDSEERFLDYLRNIDRTTRGMVGSLFDARQTQLTIVRNIIRFAPESGRPIPEWLTRIYNEILHGTFR